MFAGITLQEDIVFEIFKNRTVLRDLLLVIVALALQSFSCWLSFHTSIKLFLSKTVINRIKIMIEIIHSLRSFRNLFTEKFTVPIFRKDSN